MRFLKIITPFLLVGLLLLKVNQSEGSGKIELFNTPQKPVVRSLIDTLKYDREIKSIDTIFTNLSKIDAFNGNVLVAKGSQIIYQKSFGYAIKEKNIQLNDTSLFQLASISKVITGIATLKLYEDNKLNLDSKVCDILDSFPYKDITVKHLLTHRSGLSNYTYFCPEYLSPEDKWVSNQKILDIMIEHKPKPWMAPDRKFNYCNTNYILLALIIEKISGLSYTDFLKEQIFKPIGMKHSYTALNIDSTKESITHGYTMKYGWVANDRYDGSVGDKGVYTTTYDLFLLSAALYQNKILKPETQAMAYQPYSPERKEANYGFGWRMKNMNDSEKEVFHNGWWHGYRTAFHRRLRDSVTIIVLSNRLNKSVYNTWKVFEALDGSSVNDISSIEE